MKKWPCHKNIRHYRMIDSLNRFNEGLHIYLNCPPSEVLGSKKKSYSDLAKDVNNIKVAIDQTRRKLEELRQGREEEGNIMFLVISIAFCVITFMIECTDIQDTSFSYFETVIFFLKKHFHNGFFFSQNVKDYS